MIPNNTGYSIFQKFIDTYLPHGFANISRQDPFMMDMEKTLKTNNQFFYLGDLIQLRIIFTSDGSREIIGMEPAMVDPGTFFNITHPVDLERHNLARMKLIKFGHDLFIKGQGTGYISVSFRTLRGSGEVFDLFYQGYFFFTTVPYKTVFLLMVLTDVSNLKPGKIGYHYYVGEDPSFFRFPDADLLRVGSVFSQREFEIIRLIASGYDSKHIAEKLFLSVNTVNTHRRNMLQKSGKANTTDLIIDLKEMGVL